MLTSLSARIGSRPRRSLAVMLIVVIVAGVVGGPITGALQGGGGFAPHGSDSQAAIRQVERVSGNEPSPGITLLVRTPDGARAAAGRAAITSAARRLAAIDGIAHAAPSQIAPGGREAFVEGTIRSAASDDDVASDVEDAFTRSDRVAVGGSAVANEQVSSTISKDLGFAEALAAPLLVVLSLLFFRGRATWMPLLVGVTTVLGTFLVLTGVNHFYTLSIFALNLVIGSGLGLAVDYTLFIVTRFREELATGADTPTAIAETMRHAGRTVIFSALTVAAAAATMILFPEGFLKSMGLAGAITALVAAAASVLISPALLALWGPKLARPTVGAQASSGRWYRFAHAVMRRPGAIALVAAAAMLAASAPALSVHWSPASDSRVIPAHDSSRVVADALTRDFGASTDSPVSIVLSAGPGAAGQIRAYASQVARLRGVDTRFRARGGAPRARYLGRDTWLMAAQVHDDSSGPVAQRAVSEIRALSPPFTALVTGDAATFADQQHAIADTLPYTIGLLVALEFTILWLMTGSFVLPLKAIVMNALTVGAALSAIVLIYQHGNLTGLLHYTPNGGVEPTDFVVAATVVFALSTDYGVFLLGRIKEARDRALTATSADALDAAGEREAVATGLAQTGRVVTAAAILLAVAIGAFSTSEISFIQQIGLAVGLGVLLDAFIVRSLLVPSLMALLGRWNWWSPAPVRRLHTRLAVAA